MMMLLLMMRPPTDPSNNNNALSPSFPCGRWLAKLLLSLSILSCIVSRPCISVDASPLSNGPWGPTNPIASKDAVVIVPGPTTTANNNKEFVRITVLTDRLLRIERSNSSSSSTSTFIRSNNTTTTSTSSYYEDIKFEDRKTIAVINRKLDVPNFTHTIITKNDNNTRILKIHTKCLDLSYKIGSIFSAENLYVTGSMNCYQQQQQQSTTTTTTTDGGNNNNKLGVVWTYRYGDIDPHNLLGTIRTLDQENATTLNCTLRNPMKDHCEWGLISKSGYSVVNDTLNYALTTSDNSNDDGNGGDWWDGRNRDLEDIYIFGHGHDYKAALEDYTKIGGTIPLLPKYSLGVWFSRWYDYTASSVDDDIIKQYEYRSLPLDVLVLDMNWHKKNHWTGYSFDKKLYGSPQDALSYAKYKGLAVTLNLHDAKGMNPWEDMYNEYCKAIGGGGGGGYIYNASASASAAAAASTLCQERKAITFSIMNATILYALEDIVLKPLEDNGVNFWWIDWQQGEGPGKFDAAGGKQNPTIWTAHIRSTDANRRRQQKQKQESTTTTTTTDDDDTLRTMVLARWGGLGAHRYPVHFSGDVRGLTWENLSYQPYFSMTGINVGAIWSHDIGGKQSDHELFTRWLQWGVVSGIMRSHDRGQSAGGCATKNPPSCSAVIPWNASPKYAEANYEALRLRGSLVPYLYTAAYKAHKTGLWFNQPMYYEYPELDAAYETSNFRPDPKAKYDSQYFFGDDMWAAPVVRPANTTDGLARLVLWVPPGLWVGTSGGQVLMGNQDGSTSVHWIADLNDIPIFARAGAIIPTIPVIPGQTIGLAMKPYDELIWNVYLADGAPASGSGVVYEDDGLTTAYYDRKSFTLTTATYNISGKKASSIGVAEEDRKARWLNSLTAGNGKTFTFTVSTEGHCEKLPTARATTLRLVNMLPPNSVVVNGLSLPYARFGGRATWSYDSKDAAVKIELPVSQVAEGLQVVVEMSSTEMNAKDDALLDGLGFRLRRCIAAKATLDEVRITPGSQTGQDKLPGNLLLAASAGSSLEYFAGRFSNGQFSDLLRSYLAYIRGAVEEVSKLKRDDDGTRNRIARATELLVSAMKV